MYTCISKYSGKQVSGIDWLGNDIAGKAIAPNYWKEISPVKLLLKQLDQDSLMNEKLSILETLNEEKYNLVKICNIKEINDGRYDSINRLYYKKLAELLKNTPYQTISDFYTQRDEKIAQNITQIIQDNPGKKMLFLVGADHRSYSLETIENKFGNSIIIHNP